MNHNIFEKILVKYWKERFNGILYHMEYNFVISTSDIESEVENNIDVYYWITQGWASQMSMPKSIMYLSLYNHKRKVCVVCGRKYSAKEPIGVTRCCIKENVFNENTTEDSCIQRKIDKYKWVYEGFKNENIFDIGWYLRIKWYIANLINREVVGSFRI